MGEQTPSWNLRPLWDELIDIYKVFAGICAKHALRYYACGGTALGAVRHHGFIPWDDDLDIFMPRPDYTLFVKIADNDLPPNLFWRSIETDRDYPLEYGKIILNDEKAVRQAEIDSGIDLSQGIFIDVQPLDGVPAHGLTLWWWLVRRSLWRHLPQAITGNQRARLRHQRFLSAIDYDTAERVEDAKERAARLRRTAWTQTTFGDPVWMDFDSVKMPVAHDWDEYLAGSFGPDYMILPPPELRVPSHLKACMI